MVKNTGCFSREPRFNAQPPQVPSRVFVTLVLGNTAYSFFCRYCTHDAQTYMKSKQAYTKIIKFKDRKFKFRKFSVYDLCVMAFYDLLPPPRPNSKTQVLYELQLWLHSETPISELNKHANKQTKKKQY